MKTALITGGSKGIGLGIAEVLLREGWHVAITGRNPQTIDTAVAHLSRIGPERALGIVADVRHREAVAAGVKKLEDAWGRLDVLVANAGVGYFAAIDEMTPEQWHEMLDTNLTGVFYSVRAGLPLLKKSKGYIFTMASLAGANFFANGSGYNATKFGLVGFTQAMMLDLRAHGIRVSTIMPGSVATHFNGHVPSAADEWKIQPEDIGQIIADVLKLNPRTLPSKIEVRPSLPPGK
jgi:NAD(P)-dependent dehydrogenase (short-subunit alcohol dehydrogenase family)